MAYQVHAVGLVRVRARAKARVRVRVRVTARARARAGGLGLRLVGWVCDLVPFEVRLDGGEGAHKGRLVRGERVRVRVSAAWLGFRVRGLGSRFRRPAV